MGLFSRGNDAAAQAVYARSIDGRHLWLAVRGTGGLRLVGDGVEIAVPTEQDGDLLTAVVALPEDGPRLSLVSGAKGTPVVRSGPALGDLPTIESGPWRVEGGEHVTLTRTPDPDHPVALRFALADDVVELTVDGAGPVLTFRSGDTVLAERPVTDGVVRLGEFPELPPGTTARTDVARRANVVARPHAAVVLPPLPERDVELRWLRNGFLAVHRREEEQ